MSLVSLLVNISQLAIHRQPDADQLTQGGGDLPHEVVPCRVRRVKGILDDVVLFGYVVGVEDRDLIEVLPGLDGMEQCQKGFLADHDGRIIKLCGEDMGILRFQVVAVRATERQPLGRIFIWFEWEVMVGCSMFTCASRRHAECTIE